MTFNRSSVICSSLLLLLIQQQQQQHVLVNAFPTGAGSCIGGVAAVGGAHLSVPTINNGTLKDYGITLSFDTLDLTPTYPRKQFYTDFETNVQFNVALKATDTPMTGCFIRFSTETNSSKDAFTLEPVNNTKLADACSSITDATGITHTSSDDKTICSGTISVAYSGTIYIDATVVIGLEGGVSSTYGYDRFELHSAVTLPPITESPSTLIAPSMTPATTMTSIAPAPVMVATSMVPVPDMLESDSPSSFPSSLSDSPSTSPSISTMVSISPMMEDMPSLVPVSKAPVPKPVAAAPVSAPISSATRMLTGTMSLIIGLLSVYSIM